MSKNWYRESIADLTIILIWIYKQIETDGSFIFYETNVDPYVIYFYADVLPTKVFYSNILAQELKNQKYTLTFFLRF